MNALKELTVQKLESLADLEALIEGDIIEARLPDYEGPVAVIKGEIHFSNTSSPWAFIRRGKKNSQTILLYSPYESSSCWTERGKFIPWGIKMEAYSGGEFYNKCLEVLDRVGM